MVVFQVRRGLLVALMAGALLALGVAAGLRLSHHPPEKEQPMVIDRLRAVARLQVLEVSISQKVLLAPEPQARAGLLPQVAQWARYTVAPPEGRALVFADAHFSVDLSKLDARAVRVRADAVELELPELQLEVHVRPGDTDVISSNLDSTQTAELLERAEGQLLARVSGDQRLRERARASAEQTLRAFLLGLGFQAVRFSVPSA